MSTINRLAFSVVLVSLFAPAGANATHRGAPHGGGGGSAVDLVCTEGQVAKWISGKWACGADSDTSALTECAGDEALLANGDCVALTAVVENLFRTRTLFVTSERYTGAIDGLEGADQICNDHATSAGAIVPEGDYVAVLSSSTEDAAVRVGVTMGPIIASNGLPIAENVVALFAQSALDDPHLSNSPKWDEAGVAVANVDAMTGSDKGGARTSGSAGGLCDDWTSEDSGKNFYCYGGPGYVSSAWVSVDDFVQGCEFLRSLYCMQK